MPTTIGLLTPNGLEAVGYTAESLAEAATHEPEGVYSVARTFHHDQELMLDAHLDRMEESARIAEIPLQLDRAALRGALRELIAQAGYPEARFRITVPRQAPDHRIITLEPFEAIPAALRQKGVAVATVPIQREAPQAKLTEWMAQRAAAKQQHAPDAYECIIVDEQEALLEGFGSNFYAVVDGVLYTAPDDTVLNGIARRITLTIAPEVTPVKLAAVRLAQLPQLDETFLTSSSRGVIPITRINATVIGNGQPGPYTQQLANRYDAWVEAHLAPI